MRLLPSLVQFLIGSVVLLAGWWAFWFLCDDAYISFRYVRMAQEGHGYVWNAEPFRPVEGYTSVAWVVLLDLTWRWLGVAPPEAANRWSLLFSLGSLVWVLRLASRLPLQGTRRLAASSLVLFAVLSNPTWLTWTSSGLETALWTFLLLAWLDVSTLPLKDLSLRVQSVVAALLPLVRPDGLLFAGLSPVWSLWRCWRSRGLERGDAWLLLPSLLPLAHVLWRLQTYGAWLPNTYTAKVVEPWPLMGGLYLLLFLYEYALWVPLLLGLVAAWRRGISAVVAVPVAMIALQLGFHLWQGGDHFEFRILVHWVLLLWLGLFWALAEARSVVLFGVAACVWLAGAVLPWTLYGLTAEGIKHWEVVDVNVAPHLPAPLRPLGTLDDKVRRYMNNRLVAMPRYIHIAFLQLQESRVMPTEEVAWVGTPSEVPILTSYNPGFPAYYMPNVHVIDLLGLNDAVIAHTPPPPDRTRRMAHERVAPPDYVACLDPNVEREPDLVILRQRRQPFDADSVRACEDRYWTW